MAIGKACWGIDIGQCSLKAIKLRQVGDGVEVVAFDVIEHEQILSQAEGDGAALVRSALETLLSRNDFSGSTVAVTVPGHQTFARFTKLPPVEPKKIPDIVRFEARQQIPFEIDEVDWDYQTFTTPGSPDVEVGIFAMKRDLIRRHLAALTGARIEPNIVQTAPLALYNFLRYDGQYGKGGTVLIDIGAENTDLVVTDGQTVWSRNIPLGGNNFTEALVKAFKLSFAKAENLKRTAATSKYARQIFQAMRPVFADLVAEIQRSIGFYMSTHRDIVLNKVLGMGNAFRLPGLQKYLQQNLQMDVERVSGFNKVSLGAGVNGAQFNENILTLGVCYGAALQGLDLVEVRSNLLPVELTRAAMWRRKRPFFAGAAACLLLAAGALWVRGVVDRSALATSLGDEVLPSKMSLAEAKRIELQGPDENQSARSYAAEYLAAAEALKREWSRLQGEAPAGKRKIVSITSLVDDEALWLRILSVVHGALPEPQADLAQAQGPEQYRKACANIPRQQRRQIFIESFETVYAGDVHGALASGARRGGMGFSGKGGGSLMSDPLGEVPKPGFVVTLRVRTPHERGVQFVNETLAAKLQQGGQRAELGFHIDGVDIVSFGLLSQADRSGGLAKSAGWGRSASPGSARGGGFGGKEMGPGPMYGGKMSPMSGPGVSGRDFGKGGSGEGGTSAIVSQFVDPLTGEDMSTDSVCVLRFGIVLGEPEPDAGGQEAQGGPAGQPLLGAGAKG